jgi:cell division protein FtsB
MTLGRWVGVAALLGGLAFGAWAGEYSTLDWWKLRQQIAAERQTIAELEVTLDSLTRWAERLETDPSTQEQVAREKLGMIRDGEILYGIEYVP